MHFDLGTIKRGPRKVSQMRWKALVVSVQAGDGDAPSLDAQLIYPRQERKARGNFYLNEQEAHYQLHPLQFEPVLKNS